METTIFYNLLMQPANPCSTLTEEALFSRLLTQHQIALVWRFDFCWHIRFHICTAITILFFRHELLILFQFNERRKVFPSYPILFFDWDADAVVLITSSMSQLDFLSSEHLITELTISPSHSATGNLEKSTLRFVWVDRIRKSISPHLANWMN